MAEMDENKVYESLKEMNVPLSVVVGTAKAKLGAALHIEVGSVIDFDEMSIGKVTVYAADQKFAHGELVEFDGVLGVRLQNDDNAPTTLESSHFKVLSDEEIALLIKAINGSSESGDSDDDEGGTNGGTPDKREETTPNRKIKPMDWDSLEQCHTPPLDLDIDDAPAQNVGELLRNMTVTLSAVITTKKSLNDMLSATESTIFELGGTTSQDEIDLYANDKRFARAKIVLTDSISVGVRVTRLL